MTQALLPLPNIAVQSVERCNATEVEVHKIRECPGSSGRLTPQTARVEMGMVGESELPAPKSKADKIQEGLERTISDDAKQRIDNVLNEVNQLTDVEKLLLYLKLPTGAAIFPNKDGSSASAATPNRLETIQAATWIKSHLEEDVGTSLPKQEVFEDYKVYSESHGYKPLSQADFGKAMKCVFPNVKARRLGQRGQSKHCYGGLRKKLCVKPPVLPDLNLDETPEEPKKEEEGSGCDEVIMAASDLVCEWSQKLLNHQFGNLKDLAAYLIDNMYVSSRSMAAFTIITSSGKTDPAVKGIPTGNINITPTNTLSRHRETQLQLQRKLQEREQIKEQKRKLEQQRSAMKSRSGDASDSRSADDSSRESEKGDICSGALTLSMSQVRGGRQGGDHPRGKPQTPLTPQKVILPKMGPSNAVSTAATAPTKPAAAVCTVSPTDTKPVISTAVTVNGTATGAQQILVFSPTPHMSQQPAAQQLVILSPIGRGTAPLQPTNSQQAMPVQPVIMSTLGNQSQPTVTTPFTPKAVNVVQVPLLQTQVSSQQSIHKGAMTIQAQSDGTMLKSVSSTGGTRLTTAETTKQLSTGSQFLPVTQAPPVTQVQITDIAQQWPQALGTKSTVVSQCTEQPSQTVNMSAVTGTTGLQNTSSVAVIQTTQSAPVKSAATTVSPKSESIQVATANSVAKLAASKTVSDLLKEQRGYGNGSDSKMPYVNDRRPVSELLKDIRARRHFSSNSSALVQALAAQSTNSGSTPPVVLQQVSTAGIKAENIAVTSDNTRTSAPLPTVAENAGPIGTSDNNNRSKGTTSLSELLAKPESDLQSVNVSPSTNERLRQSLTQTGSTKKRPITTSNQELPRKRQNLGGAAGTVSQETLQKTAANIIRNPQLANALMAVSPLQSKGAMEQLKQELERQLASSRSGEAAGFASRLAISLAQTEEIQKQQQQQQQQIGVKSVVCKGTVGSSTSVEKDGLIDLLASAESAPDLADITPSITQIMQRSTIVEHGQVKQASAAQGAPADKDDGSGDCKSDGAYNLSDILIKGNTLGAQKSRIKKEDSNSHQNLLFHLTSGQNTTEFQQQQQQQQVLQLQRQLQQQQQSQQQQQQQQQIQPQSAPNSGHSTPCPSPGPSDPRQPFINLRGDVLLSQSATPKSAQITMWQKQLLQQQLQQHQQQQQQQQQQQHQRRQYQQQRQRHRSMPDQVLRQQISNINFSPQLTPQNEKQQLTAQTLETLATSLAMPQQSQQQQQQRTVMVTTMPDGSMVQLQPQQVTHETITEGVVQQQKQQQQQQLQLTAAIQSNPTLTAQLLQNNMVLNLASLQQQQQQQNMQQELPQQQQPQPQSNSGMSVNVAIAGSVNANNTGLVSLPQSPAQLMSPNSGSAQRSAASTPMSVLSPQTPMSHGMGHSRSIGPSPVEMASHAFMPIQNLQLEGGGNVSLVRPTATIASTVAPSTVVNTTEQQLPVTDTSGFQPYGTIQPAAPSGNNQNEQVQQQQVTLPLLEQKQLAKPGYNSVVRQKLAEKLGLHSSLSMPNGKETAYFAPASSIKPVKRGGRGTNKGAGRRQRHHSAQSALGGPQSAAGGTGALLRQRARATLQPMQQQQESQSHTTLQQQQQQQQQPQHAPATAAATALSSAVIGDVNMGLGPSTPESPFSPEISDILNSASHTSSVTSHFRSQSVPVNDLFFDGDYGGAGSDIFGTGSTDQKGSELMDELSGNDISSLASLLQEKLHDDSGTVQRGLHLSNMSGNSENFVARRNLTELIEQRSLSQQQQQQQMIPGKEQMKTLPSDTAENLTAAFDFDDNSSINLRGRGDVTLTSASLCDNSTQLRQMQGLSVVLPTATSSTSNSSGSNRGQVMTQASNVIDFSAEVQNIVSQSTAGTLHINRLGSNGGVNLMSTLDTPSSMDTTSTQDSRDSLADSLFQNSYDAGSDFSQNLGHAQSMDIVTSSDFTFPQWELGQMVHD